MPAPKRVPDATLVATLQRWGGNVTATAEDLGLNRSSVQKRIDALAIDLASLRAATFTTKRYPSGEAVPMQPYLVPDGQRCPSSPLMPGPRVMPTAAHVDRNRAAVFSSPVAAPTLGGMQTAAAAEVGETPIKAAPPRRFTPRLKQAHQDRLREAKLLLGAKHMVETDENHILEQLLDEELEGWIARKLGVSQEER